MVIIGRSFEEVQELLEKAMKRKYPNEMKVTIFVDDGCRASYLLDKDLEDNTPKKRIEASYDDAVDLLNDILEISDIEDLYDFDGGIEMTIKIKLSDFEITDEEMQMVMDSTIVDIIESKGRITKAEYQSALLGACKMYDYLLDKVVNKGVLET